jgi:serine/threonine protein kinase
VSELLQQNLYEFGKRLRAHRTAVASNSSTSSSSASSSSSDGGVYFTPNRLARVAMQCLEALAYINSLGLMHCDVKVRNVFYNGFANGFANGCFQRSGDCLSYQHTGDA